MSRIRKALIIVDMQRDFCYGGALAVEDSDNIIPLINRFADIFSRAGGCVYATRDIHPKETVHFKAFGGQWPPHCVEGTPGAEFHPALKLPEGSVIITKGLDPKQDCYSAFEGFDDEGRTLRDSLLANDVGHIYLSGVATNYCVQATARDGLVSGFGVTVLIDAVRGIKSKDNDPEDAIREMRKLGVETRDFNSLLLQLSRLIPKERR